MKDMKLFDQLDDDTFLIYAAKNYYNPTCIDADEFHEDLKRFKYIKRLITRYVETGNASTNLLLNHLVIVFNVFGIESGLRMLEYKCNTTAYLTVLKPFLIYLKVIENDKYTEIDMDGKIVEELRKI